MRSPAPRLRRLFTRTQALAGDRGGNFIVLFSLMAPVLLLVAGLGLDFLTSLSFKARWDAAADAAALAADQAAQAYAQANAATVSAAQLIANAKAAGVAAGLAAFDANAGVSEVTGSVTPKVVMTNAGSVFTATATYSGSTPTHFGGLVGVPTFAVGGQAVASTSLTTYIDYYILVDVSQSMGIGDTQTDMANLYNITKQMGYTGDFESGCVFGCHVAMPGRAYSNEQVAHNNGITLRIDSAKTAIQDVINQAKSMSSSNNIRIGVYTMQLDPVTNSNTAVTISKPTSDYSALSALVSNIDLGPNNSNGLGDTDIANTLQTFASTALPSNGAGYSASAPINYVFVVTDGLIDTPGNCNVSGHCTSLMGASACSTLQANATVGVIYTTYLPIYQNNDVNQGYDPNYTLLVAPYQNTIQSSLQSCASSASFFFKADNGPALIAAMQQLFASTASTLRLTQ